MRTYVGRGILDIFVATICSSYLGGSGLNIFALILTVLLFIAGLMYLCFHFTGLELSIPLEALKFPTKSNKNNNLDTSYNIGMGLNENS